MTAIRNVLRGIPGAAPAYRTMRRTAAALYRQIIPDQGMRYDRETAQVIARLLGDGGSILDVGANRGDILGEALIANPAGPHYAVEALPDFAERLAAMSDAVTVYNCAVGETPGEATFRRVVGNECYSGLRERVYDFDNPEIEIIPVRIHRIDDLLPADVRIDLLKIDIEGGELHALKGATGVLAASRPPVIFEAGPKSCDGYGVAASDFVAFFEGQGYALTTMARWLSDAPPLGPAGFLAAWGREFYFMAMPQPRA